MEMVVREGIEGFGVNKLAKEVGVSPGTIYIHFKDKEDLLRVLCLEISAHILSSSLRGLEPGMPFETGMKLQWKNRYIFSKKYPVQLEFIEKVRYTYVYQSISDKLADAYGKPLAAFIKKAVDDKKLAKMPFEVYWSLAFAPLYQLINFSRQKSKQKQKFSLTETIFNESFHRVLKSLKP